MPWLQPSSERSALFPRPLPRSFWAFLPILLLPTLAIAWVCIRLGVWWMLVVYALLVVGGSRRAIRAREKPGSPSGRAVAAVEMTERAVIIHVLFPGPLHHRKDVVIPLAAIIDVRGDLVASLAPPGLGRSLSGVSNRRYSVGLFIPGSGKVWQAFYAVRRGMPAVVIDLHSDNFQRVIVEAADPEPVVAQVRAAVAGWSQAGAHEAERERARITKPARTRR